ncbi:MAG: YgdI/YgdR family lipoprotein [Endozoicomonadaceae bacterium]|nr:YgdI/YgdR family lipoprotein [Endozoicomonadaceae bacterium]
MHRSLTVFLSSFSILVCLILGGCSSSPHLIKLNDGREIATLDMPSYDDNTGFYHFKVAATGEEMQLNQTLIEFIVKKQ